MHKSVLLKEVIECLAPQPNQNFVDGTINGGGHSLAILEKTGPVGKILGFDLDENVLKNLMTELEIRGLKKRCILVNDSFIELGRVIKKYEFEPVAGVLLDLGMSSWQIERSGRGFSFLRDEPLDMRFAPLKNALTAKEIINQWPEEELIRIFRDYGEEKCARMVAREIIKERRRQPLISTRQLVEIVGRAISKRYQFSRLHFATKIFQALRIAVNDELGNLEKVLPQLLEILTGGGRAAIISFHSLEDRPVKRFLKEQAKKGLINILTKKPIRASQEEIQMNPRARSAKLRAFVKL